MHATGLLVDVVWGGVWLPYPHYPVLPSHRLFALPHRQQLLSGNTAAVLVTAKQQTAVPAALVSSIL